jgi:hypothetical protein
MSLPCLTVRATPIGTNCRCTSAELPRERSLSSAFGYRSTVGLSRSKAALSMPAASVALDGIATSMPGRCARVDSKVCEWNGPNPGRYPPQAASTITGARQPPQVRQSMVASSLASWLNASGTKSANCRKATGRPPARARPIEVPTMVDSLSGEFATRPGNARVSPRVTPNTSPLGSSISSP